jgi:biopolymer transport protein TolQ
MLTERIFTVAQHGAEFLLYVMLLLSVVSLGIILERFLALRTVRAAAGKISLRIRETLQSNSLQDVEEMAKDRDSLEGRALAYGVRHVKDNGANGLEEIFNTFVLLERPALEKNLSFLATIAANAPFIGLLGTVLGIMKAFNDLAVTANADNKVVMAGIAEALVATAIGLLVAIPATMAFNYFQKQVKLTLQSLESVRELCLAYAKRSKG